jgi:uncharacterized protein (DUF4415 family)
MRLSASFPRARQPTKKDEIMSISERIKTRLSKDRVMTTITLRIGQDVVDSMKTIAPRKGFAGYQTLLKSYISDGLRQDEAKFSNDSSAKLFEVLKKHGVSQVVLDEAVRELKAA